MTCAPRFATPRTPERATLGGVAANIAVALGRPLMPWQKRVLDVALELDVAGRLVYRTATVTCPRQQGKSSLIEVLCLCRALRDPGQQIIYTAQTGADARKKMFDVWWPELRTGPLGKYISARMTSGHERLRFHNGSTLGLVAVTTKAGHGGVIDLAIVDEAFSLPDHRLEQALKPGLVTRPSPQFWVVSTAGTPTGSPYLWSKVEGGRQLASADVTVGSAYFEWSAEDDADASDPATWASCMPALGHTVDEAAVRADFESMDINEFRRAYLNQWTRARNDPVIALDAWDGLLDRSSRATEDLAFALDITPDRARAAIAVAGKREDGRVHVEIVDHRARTSWVADRLAELVERHKPQAVVLDSAGPAGSLLAEMAAKGLDVESLGAKEQTAACGMFYDAVADGTLRHLGSAELTEALAGAVKRPLGDAWAWSRKSSAADISPLVAVTLAHWASRTLARSSAPEVWDLNEIVAELRAQQAVAGTPDPDESPTAIGAVPQYTLCLNCGRQWQDAKDAPRHRCNAP